MNKKEMLKIWRQENDRGYGFDPEGGRDINRLKGTGTLLEPARNTSDVAVYDYGDTYIIVGDSNGPWAVQVAKHEVRVASTKVASKDTLQGAMKAYEHAVLVALMSSAKRMPHVFKAEIGTNFVAIEMDDFGGLEASEWMITVDVEGDGTTISYWRQEAPFVNGRGQNPHTVDTYGYSSDKPVASMIRDMQATLATKRF